MTVTNTRMQLDRRKGDRRKGPDPLVKALEWLSVFGWLLMFAALFIIDRAKPQSENFLIKATKVEASTTWNQELTSALFYLMIFGLCISIIGIAINSRRYRRKDDRFRITLIMLGVISIFGIIKHFF
ncbi:MAG: hypothetical protein JYX80_10655 [Candidatus Scalindua sediminis]|nr:hypothetical protein [Candidatus Scalindua sediminis]